MLSGLLRPVGMLAWPRVAKPGWQGKCLQGVMMGNTTYNADTRHDMEA
jgi:hypothetical protein